jgi:amino-acid N-acetyltransferase
VTVDLRILERSHLSAARALLERSDLPTDDLDDPSITLIGAIEDGTFVGVVGLQACGTNGLLRSLAVAPDHRARGVAGTLCTYVFDETNARAMESLWLLTTSAKDYFTRHGFEVVPREQAPDEIRATAQFASLCPSSAHVMRRRQQPLPLVH